MQNMVCPSCQWAVGVKKAGGVFVEHTRNGTQIRDGVKKNGRRCRKSGKRAVR